MSIMNYNTQVKSAVPVFTPSDIVELIRKKIESSFNEEKNYGFFIVDGILGELKNDKYPIYYGISLKDTTGAVVLVNIPKNIVNTSYQGKEVRVSGFLKIKIWNGKLDFSIDVSKIDLKTVVSKDVLERDKTISEFLNSCKKQIIEFPDKGHYNIALICGTSSLVEKDFKEQLKDMGDIVTIKTYPVNILDASSIIKAIKEIKDADIIVLIRGGGHESEFEVFNDIKLLEAWVQKGFYRISAIGHTSHRAYIDIFSDMSCDTPTDAGRFIKENIIRLTTIKEFKTLAEKHEKVLKDTITEWQKKLQEVQCQKDRESKDLNDRIQSLIKELTFSRASVTTYKWVTLIEGIILTILLIYLFTK